MPSLQGKIIAILATNGFEESELLKPLEAVKNAGAQVHVISIQSGQIQGETGGEKGQSIAVDKTVDEVSAMDYDALILPGGVKNPDTLRINLKAVQLVKDFFRQGKPVSAICHGPWMLVEADVVEGRKLTSWPSLRTDIENAGGEWVDEEVVTDQGLTTSRKPTDLEAFCAKTVEEFAEGEHAEQAA